jgi:hypothetical protein
MVLFESKYFWTAVSGTAPVPNHCDRRTFPSIFLRRKEGELEKKRKECLFGRVKWRIGRENHIIRTGLSKLRSKK